MSIPTKVPESSVALTWDDARTTLHAVRLRPLMSRAFVRLRVADGFSHARASAFSIALLLVEGTIAVLGLAVAIGSASFTRTVTLVAETAVPGPAGQLLTSAVRQAQENGTTQQYTALVVGLLAAVITGSTAMGQFERSCNRIYGIDTDRASTRKYLRATLLAVTVGAVSALALMLMVLGRPISESVEHSSVSVLWTWGRWPLAGAVLVLAVTVLLKLSPRRRQPALSWLAVGAVISVVLMMLASVALALFFRWSTSFGDTYGPLAGMIALLLWCLGLASAGLYGISITAQLEAEHSRQRRGIETKASVLTASPSRTMLDQ